MSKRLAILLAALAVSAPAFADRGHHRGHGHYGHGYYGHGHGHRHVVNHYHYRPAPRPAVVHHYYRTAPRPVYVVRQDPVVPLLVGAVIGAAIVHHAVTHPSY
jgi:hypothetical protein